MHTLEIHLQSFKGTDQVGLGEEGSTLACHYLIVDGKHLERPRTSRDENPLVRYSIGGGAPTYFLYLEIHNPWRELFELFPLEERMATDDNAALLLPLRKVMLVPYEIPPPVTDEQYELASLPFENR